MGSTAILAASVASKGWWRDWRNWQWNDRQSQSFCLSFKVIYRSKKPLILSMIVIVSGKNDLLVMSEHRHFDRQTPRCQMYLVMLAVSQNRRSRIYPRPKCELLWVPFLVRHSALSWRARKCMFKWLRCSDFNFHWIRDDNLHGNPSEEENWASD